MPLGFFKKKEPQVLPPAQIGAFGKVPQMGDFLRTGSRLIPSFETWLEAGMAWGEKKHTAAWPTVYAAGPAHAFVFRPPAQAAEKEIVAGVLRPSRDSVGRKFPLVVFVRLPERPPATVPHLMPLVLQDFFTAASQASMDGDSTTSASEYQKRLSTMTPPALALDATGDSYDLWSYGTSLSELWTTIYGDPRSEAPLAALRAIRDALAPFAGQEYTLTPLSVRLPLGSGGASAAAFWVDVVRRIAHWRAIVPTFFSRADGILIQLGATPPNSLAELWSADPDSDVVCDLTTEMGHGRRADILRALPRDVGVKLERGNTMVSDLLEVLGR